MLTIKKFSPKNHLLKAMIYGKSGSGKTTLASTAPNPLYICTENGLASIAKKSPEYIEIQTLKGLKSIYEELKKGLDYDTIIIDSLSEIAKVIKEDLTQGNKFDMDMRRRGKYAEEMLQTIRDIIRLPYHIIAIVHDRTISGDDGIVKMIDIAIQGSAREEIPRYFDVIVYTYIKEGEHLATCKPSAVLLTKDRLNCLIEPLPLDIASWIKTFESSINIGKDKTIKKIDELKKTKGIVEKKIKEGSDPIKMISNIYGSKKFNQDEKIELENFINKLTN